MRNLFLPALLTLTMLINGCATTTASKPQAESPQLASKIYQEGRAALTAGDYENASKHFKSLEIYFPESPYTHQAQMELAYAYFKNGDYDLSIATTERFIRNYPDNENLDYAYYLRGLASFEQSTAGLKDDTPLDEDRAMQIRTSLQYFTGLEDRFPDSKYTADSAKRMAFLQERLARYDVAMAKQFIQEENYASAAIRAKSVMEHYPNSSVAGEAASLANMADEMLNTDTAPAQQMTTPAPETSMMAATADESQMTDTMAASDSTDSVTTGMMAAGGTATSQPETMTENTASEDGIHREAWLLQQNPDNYTIQLMSTLQEQPLVRFIQQHQLEDDGAYYKKHYDGKTWHTLVYGTYPDANSARTAMEALPDDLHALGPWLQNIRNVQQSIREFQGN